MRTFRLLHIAIAVLVCMATQSVRAGEPRSLIGSLPSLGSSTASLNQGVANSVGTLSNMSVPTNTRVQSLPTASAPAGTQAERESSLDNVSPYVGRVRNPQVRRLLAKAERTFVARHYEETAKLVTDPSIAEYPHAQFLNGVLHEYGLGVTRDDALAAEHYEAAAAKGHAAAQYNLGLMYNDGRGVDRMPDRALLWIELAANQGLVEAQYALGLLYYNGAGTEQDYVIALKWFEVAAGYGHTSSAENIASLARNMKKDDVVKARQLASIWKPSVRKVPPE
jgi:TPR repeat protein